MRTAHELFEVVKALSPSERRWFLQHARRHADTPQYLVLFEAMDGLSAYDERSVLDAFRGSPAVGYLPVLHTMLFKELVAALARSDTDPTPDGRVRMEIEAIRFLAEKGRMGPVERRLKKALGIARGHELASRVVELCALFRRMLPLSPRASRDLLEIESEALRTLHQEHAAMEAVLRPYDDHEVMRDPNALISARARVRAHRACLRRALHVDDSVTARGSAESIIRIITERVDLVDTHASDWMLGLVDAAQAGVPVKERLLDDLEVRSRGGDAHVQLRIARLYTHLLITGPEVVDQTLTDAIHAHADAHRVLDTFSWAWWRVHTAHAALLASQPEVALSLLNDVLADTAVRTLVPCAYDRASVLNVQVHTDLGNAECAESALRAVVRRAPKLIGVSRDEVRALRRSVRSVLDRGLDLDRHRA